MFRRICSIALLSGLVGSSIPAVAQPAAMPAVDPRTPPAMLPPGTMFPPSVPPAPVVAPPSAMPVEYLPSEMSLVGGDEFVPRLWLDPEVVLWRVRKGAIGAPLVTTGPASSFGIVGRAGTSIVSQDRTDFGTMVGARLMGGVWYDDSHTFGLEGGFTWFGSHSDERTFRSDGRGNPVLSRPFRDAASGNQAVRAVSLPGAFSGSVTVLPQFSAWGAEFDPLVVRLSHGEHFYVYGLIGFKYFNLNERLVISDTSLTLPGGQASFRGQPFGAGSRISVGDSFDTSNDLYGGQIGTRFGFDYNRFFVDATTKLGFMHNHMVQVNSGGTSVRSPQLIQRGDDAVGGLLVGPFNGRRESQAGFAIMPEVNLQLGYQLTTRMSIFLGYNFLYISSVIRPGDQVQRTVNAAFSPASSSFGAAVPSRQPVPVFVRDEFIANGLSVGLSLRY